MNDITQDLFTSLVKSTLLALCRNKNLLRSVNKIDGLLGITLENKEVLLINISEYLSTSNDPSNSELRNQCPDLNISNHAYPEKDKVYVYLNEDGDSTDKHGNDNVTAITIEPTGRESDGDRPSSTLEDQVLSESSYSSDEWTPRKKKSRKRKKNSSQVRQSAANLSFREMYDNCETVVENKELKPGQTLTGRESDFTKGEYTPKQSVTTPKRKIDRSCPEVDWGLPDYDNPPEPAEKDLSALHITRDTALNIYSEVDNYPNFATAVMCHVFTEKERMVECNVQGWGKRPKLDTDPEQKRINAIYSLTYHMYRIRREEKDDAKRKITINLDCRNRNLRRVHREQFRK